ncbi:hypothetical protein Taro_014211, partial [Colocasia esculenta]|nr:hypothetical protein [Colocasia esculenta]
NPQKHSKEADPVEAFVGEEFKEDPTTPKCRASALDFKIARHHVIEENVIEEDEEDEIDSQDDIDDNENMDEGDDEPLFDIAKVNNTEIEYKQDPPDIFTSGQ